MWKAAETSVYFLANRVKISSFSLSTPLTKIWPIIESLYWPLYSMCIERGAWYRMVNNTDMVSPWTYHLVNVGSWISRRLSNVWAPSASSTAPHSHSTWDLNDGETCKTRDRKWWNEIKSMYPGVTCLLTPLLTRYESLGWVLLLSKLKCPHL